MEIGFDTVGNATLVLHDKVPLLATDPWITGSAYFGSWALSHEIPAEQADAVRRCKYLWISHGHPDHLNGESLETQRDKIILLPDHRGGRVFQELRQQGFQVRLIRDRAWFELSPRVRILSIADYNQDALLLADVNGRLVVNLNDAGDRGCGSFVRNIVRRYKRSFLLSLVGRGAGMMNYFDEDGRRVPPDPKTPVGQTLFNRVLWWGTTAAIPFSSMHRFQRTDSAWAIPYGDTLEEYADGFDDRRAELLPAYVRVDCATDDVTPLHPRAAANILLEPREFGDDWSERLERDDKAALRAYFARFEHLRKHVDFLRFVVGGEETIVELGGSPKLRGATFEVPRTSLTTAVKYEIFDDLLIGNFMKVTLHGEWSSGRLDSDFSNWVAKYGDNGRAHTLNELREYRRSYFERAPTDYLRHRFETKFLQPLQQATSSALRSRLGADSALFRATKQAYWGIRSRLI
jgi:hypothetical protein